MSLSEQLLKYLLKEEAGLPTLLKLGKKGTNLFKNLDTLGNEAKVLKLKTLLNSLDDIASDPQQAAKLANIAKKDNVSVRDLIRKASSVGANEEAGKVADDLEKILKKYDPDISAAKTQANPQIQPTPQAKTQTTPQTRSQPKFKNPESQELADKIEGLKKAGATDEEIKPLRDQLLRNEGASVKEFDNTTKRLQELQNDYETAIKTGGEDSPRAKLIKKEMEKLNQVTSFTKIRRFCMGSYKKGGLCLAVLGAAGYKAYDLIDSIISPAPSPTPKSGPSPSPVTVSRKCKGSLKRGCKGDNVKELQKKLINCGYSLPKKGADGIFGSETKSAVSSFQKDNGLKVDGIAGKETLKALESCKSKGKDVEEKPSTEQTPVPVEQTPEVSPASKTKEKNVGPGFLERTFQDVEKMKKNPPSDDLTSRDTARKQWEEEDEKFKNFKADLGESKINKKFDIINSRNNTLEKLVFERLVKNAN